MKIPAALRELLPRPPSHPLRTSTVSCSGYDIPNGCSVPAGATGGLGRRAGEVQASPITDGKYRGSITSTTLAYRAAGNPCDGTTAPTVAIVNAAIYLTQAEGGPMVRLIVCTALLLATLGDATAQRRGMGGGGRARACVQTVSAAHPLGSPECQRIIARLSRCQTYIRGNIESPKIEGGRAQIQRCMHGRPDPYLTHFGAGTGGAGAGRDR
jgi:hypothetical protein